MRFLHVSFENFRNIESARLDTSHQRLFLLGKNGQGKSNLLEGLGLITALRSFRTSETRHLIRRDADCARVLFRVEVGTDEVAEIELRLERGRKKLLVDGNPVRQLSEYIGRFPAVVLASEDLQLLRGSPGLRRRFIDLTFAATVPSYYQQLRDYNQVIQQRNHLLKSRAEDREIDAFERILAPLAAHLVALRKVHTQALSRAVAEAYAVLSDGDEEPELVYRPDFDGDAEGFAKEYLKRRERDRASGTTSRGSHRDDLLLKLQGRAAREYGSDGQQRGLVLALRLAQRQSFLKASGTQPVVLADDILNELDPERQERFWSILGPEQQVFASGTRPPAAALKGEPWGVFRVESGRIFSGLTDVEAQG